MLLIENPVSYTHLDVYKRQAYEMAQQADGVIVGSAIVKIIAQHGKDSLEPVCSYVREMKEAVVRAQ